MTRWFLYRFSPWLLAWFTLAVLIAGLLTETGFKLLWGQLRHVLPDGIQVQRVAGSLLVGPRIYGLKVEVGELRVQARSIELDWSMLDQFGSHWQVRQIRLRDLNLKLPNSSDTQDEQSTPAALQWPQLPPVVVREIDVGQVRLWNTEQGDYAPILQRLLTRVEVQADGAAIDATRIELPHQPPLQLRLNTQWPQPSEGVAELSLQLLDPDTRTALGSALKAQLQIGLDPQLRVTADVSAAGLMVSPWVPELTDALELDLRLDWDGLNAVASVRDAVLRSRWRNHALEVALPSLRWDGALELKPALRASLGTAEVSAEGILQRDSAMDIVAKIPADMQVLAGWHTPLELRAQIRGQMERPWAVVYAHFDDWAGPDWTVSSGDLAGRLSLDPGVENQAVIRAQNAAVSGQQLEQAELILRGSLNQLFAQWQLRANGMQVAGEGRAQLSSKGQRQATLSRLDLDFKSWEQWRLEKPLRFKENGQNWSLNPSCLLSPPASLCLRAQQAAQRQAHMELQGYPLNRVAQWLGQSPELIQGDLQLQAELSQTLGADPQLALQWTTSPVTLGGVSESQLPGLQWAPGRGSVNWTPLDAELRWNWPLAGSKGGLQVHAQLKDGQEIEKAQLQLKLDELAGLSPLLSEVQELSGQLLVDLQAQGQLNQVRYQGQLLVDQARARLLAPGILVDKVRIQLQGNEQQLDVLGSMHSGRGRIVLSGQLTPLDQSAQIRIQGDNFEVLRTELGQVEISPQLDLDWSQSLLKVAGELRVPKADLHPDSLPTAGPQFIAPSRDEIVLGEEAQVANSQALKLAADLRLVVDSSAHFEGFGLKTNLRGDLRIQQEPERDPTANGTLELIDGSYKAYGQDLNIQRGRLIFSGGGLDEPGIDLRAFRQPRADVQVGIQARGPARKPEISLWSNPGMNQTEQLSWLVLGRSSQNLNQAEQSSMQNAALALGLKGSDILSKRFKGKLGLDELSIGTRPGEETSQAALVLGKYLNPKLYVSYGIGLFEPIYSFRARYEISSKWTLQTESGVESGGDLVYTIER